jgi:ribosome-associated protein
MTAKAKLAKNVPDTPEYELDDVLKAITEAAHDKRAQHVRVMDIRKVVDWADAVVIASGNNTNQLGAISDNVVDVLKTRFNLKPTSIEGKNAESWVCMDYGDIIVHIFYDPARRYYDIDNLWPTAIDRPDLVIDTAAPSES